MDDIPKLTPQQAAMLRAWCDPIPKSGDAFHDMLDIGVISGWSALTESGIPNADVTDLGRAALAAYDAEQRRQIRLEAMLECKTLALDLWRDLASAYSRAEAVVVADAIEKLIDAEEASNG